MKEFEEYLRKGIIKRQREEISKTKSLVEESERKFNSLNKILSKIGLEEENANDIIEYCYDIILFLLRARLCKEGYKSSGDGSHEAEVSYMIKLGFSESETRFMDELRYYRNGIKYYGKRFNKEYAQQVISFMNRITKRLKEALK